MKTQLTCPLRFPDLALGLLTLDTAFATSLATNWYPSFHCRAVSTATAPQHSAISTVHGDKQASSQATQKTSIQRSI